MPLNNRLEQIAALVNEHGFLSVEELSQLCAVSKMTIRRDLEQLEKDNRIRRTFGGVASLPQAQPILAPFELVSGSNKPDSFFVDRVDVLIATSVNPKYDSRLLESISRKNIPIIAESLVIQDEESVVAVDNFQAGLDMGRWAGNYASEHWDRKAFVLDLTFSLSNTLARSRGFTAGIRDVIPETEIVLSINAQSRRLTAYQVTRDALTVHKNINIIFAINDSTAWGAINACKDLNIDPQSIIVLPFGLEGDTLKNALMAGDYCPAGLAMFPEIVGPCCIEAAIAAYNHLELPNQIITPHVILTSDTLPEFYEYLDGGWHIRMQTVSERLKVPLQFDPGHWQASTRFPKRIGSIIPFSEHEWYKVLTRSMSEYSQLYQIEYESVDVEQNLKDEVEQRRRLIAKTAADQVHANEVILLDGGPIANYLAEFLVTRENLTIITNSMPAFDILKRNSANTLICTGGAYRSSSQLLVGPPAEGTLRGLRVDKLFLMISGISLNFGLSHTNISEVTIKQAMIQSAREVILLADTTNFEEDSLVQVAPLSVVHKLITDDNLPASMRLDLNKLGIQILLADGR